MGGVSQPSGPVTLVFTDIEGSTRLLEELGVDGYREALAEHRRVVREACARHSGYEVDYEGDAFFYAFPSASDAVSAVAQAMHGLDSGPISIRVGIHTGSPELDPPKYVGMDVHTAARIMSSGHGGQVVVSPTTAALVEAELIELGEHRLKDIAEPVALYQLGTGSFPPLKTISNTNLPRPASSFVGRKRELSSVLACVEKGARLVTLTGPGGTGKTRLALEAASSLVPEYKAGVFWVGLAALRDPALVTETIAQTLGAKDGLAEHIGEREIMLLLDNFEQVIEAAPQLSELLQGCPNLTLLVTSRELLRVRGEVEYPVPPLDEPEAVSLFCERAQLEPSEEIAELCARLDSLPLAVELAAARTKALSPSQILERLAQRLDLLKGGRDSDPRQQTLRATIEWSYDLLSAGEQQLFARLSVFTGGCTIEAAEEVCDADVDTLQSLVEKSLLRFTDERYWMLETIREFAAERLTETPMSGSLRARHADFFFSLVRTGAQLTMTDEVELLAAEQANVHDALIWASEQGNVVQIASAVGSLWRLWLLRGQTQEGVLWADAALHRREDLDAKVLIPLLSGTSELFRFVGDYERSKSLKKELLEVDRRTGRTAQTTHGGSVGAHTLADLADIAFDEKQFELARDYLEESLALGGGARALLSLGDLFLHEGNLDEAQHCIEQSLTGFEGSGHDYNYACALESLGEVALRRGDQVRAVAYFARALEKLRPAR